MSKFEYLSKYAVQDEKTAEYIIHYLPGPPVLFVLPATEANKSYWKAILKKLNESKNFRRKTVTDSMLKENRKDDRVLFGQYIIKGWKDMTDGDTGQDIPFSTEDCAEFIQALPDHLFDELREFCTDPENFIDYIDVDAISKN